MGAPAWRRCMSHIYMSRAGAQWGAGITALAAFLPTAERAGDVDVVIYGQDNTLVRGLTAPPVLAGAVPTTALAVVTELFRDWAGPLAAPALDVIYRYFTEVPRLTDQVGVAEAEKLAAAAQGAH
jgi:hypothetical protein